MSQLKPLQWSKPGETGWTHARGLFSSWSAGPWKGKFATTGNGSSPDDKRYETLEEAQAAIEAEYQEYARPYLVEKTK